MILRALRRLRYARDLRRETERPLAHYFPLWARSDAVYSGPVGPGAQMVAEAMALDRIVRSAKVSDEDLVAGLGHMSPLVAGYCLEALSRRRRLRPESLPASAKARREAVLFRLGCFAIEMPLSERIALHANGPSNPEPLR